MKFVRCAILPIGGLLRVTNPYTDAHTRMHKHTCTYTSADFARAIQHILDKGRKTKSPYSGSAIIHNHNPLVLRLPPPLLTPSDTFLIESQIQYRHLFIFIQLTLCFHFLCSVSFN